MSRAHEISDPALVGDPEYEAGLRAAVTVGVDHALSALDGGPELEPPPPVLLDQARQAARYEISLDTVLRRYFAGYTLLNEFVGREAREIGPGAAEEAQSILGAFTAPFDRLVVAVTEAHREETERRRHSVERTRAQRVKALLAAELVGDVNLGYEFGGWHLGAIAMGPAVLGAVRELARKLDRRLLAVCPGEGALWAWLGGRDPLDAEALAAAAEASLPPGATMSIGEPGRNLEGWRLTHRQARAALPIAASGERRVIRYRDVALLAHAISDELLRESLHELYLAPLAAGTEGGATLRQTLRAYFASARNVSSAAAGLGVSRTTFASRLCAVEARIGRPLESCAADLQTALELQELSEAGTR